jgi:hypothetical protein
MKDNLGFIQITILMSILIIGLSVGFLEGKQAQHYYINNSVIDNTSFENCSIDIRGGNIEGTIFKCNVISDRVFMNSNIKELYEQSLKEGCLWNYDEAKS